jgi:hypothetical protein
MKIYGHFYLFINLVWDIVNILVVFFFFFLETLSQSKLWGGGGGESLLWIIISLRVCGLNCRL